MSNTLLKKVYIDPDNNTSINTLDKINESDLSAALQAKLDTNKVKVTSNDTTPDYLHNKLIAGDGITTAETDDGSDESVTITAKGQVKVSSNDTTINYLEDKITGSTFIQVETINDGGNEDVQLSFITTALIGLHLGWVESTINSAATRNDETEFDAESIHIKPATGSQKNIFHREDVALDGSMGILENIGSAQAMSSGDWTAVNGLLFEYIAENGNWFNIKNDGTATNGNFKPLLTGCAGDIYFVSRALFSYDSVIGKWILLSYTKARWFRRVSIGAGNGNEDILIIDELPQAGYYSFYVFITVSETDSNGAALTAVSQQLLVKSGDDGTPPTFDESLVVDKSGRYEPDGINITKWFSESLQGSGIISVPGTTKAHRNIYINATLPNGSVSATIDSGYIHIHYLGVGIVG